jgi:hypothetical protein
MSNIRTIKMTYCTEVPRLMRILGLEKTVLRKICISGTLLMEKSPTCMYIFKPKTEVVGSAVVETA